MTYTVAVIEDVQSDLDALTAHFKKYGEENGCSFEIRHYGDGAAFLNGYAPIFDLVMMDISLPKYNGLTAAAKLREIDEFVALVFVTSLARYAAKGYEVDAMDYLVKPVSYETFAIKLKRILRRVRQNLSSQFIINTKEGISRISTTRIKYIEVLDHSLVYHTTMGDLRSTGKLQDVEDRLGSGFIRSNRCYLVNLSYVLAVRGDSLVVDGVELKISRPRREAVLAALNAHLGGGL